MSGANGDDAHRPMLADLRVVDVAGEALTYAGRMFADLGADVILVEPPGGSTARTIPPCVSNEEGSCSAHFAFMAAGKRSLALDVDVPRGRSVLERLLRASDVVLVPGDVDEQRARRLDPVTLRALDPRLVVTSATGFGTTGPRRHWRSSDIVGWATSGAMYGIGDADRPPVAPGGGLGTTASALNAAMGTMLALRSRRRRGAGQVVDVSLQEAVLSVSMEAGPLLTMEGAVQQRAGRRRLAAHGNFPVRDGTVEIVAFLPTQWDAMAAWIRDELGVEEATMDEFRGGSASRVHFAELIEGWVLELCSRYTRQEFFAEAQRRRVPCGPVNSPADLLTDPQLEAVGAWVEVAHPDVGSVRLPRSPVRFDGVALPVGPVPAPGEHGVAVLREVAGLTDAQIAALLGEGVLSAGVSRRSA